MRSNSINGVLEFAAEGSVTADSWPAGMALAFAGRPDLALDVYRRGKLESTLQVDGSNQIPWALQSIGQMIALLREAGDTAAAERLLSPFTRVVEAAYEHGGRYWYWRVLRAQALELGGDRTRALDEIDAAVVAPGTPFPPVFIDADPVFRDVRTEARFQAALATLKTRQADMRRRLATVQP